jgi:uncharacterized damage-inducible protein DinB
MLPELQPIWKQFQETYDALRLSLGSMPDEWMGWLPSPTATSVAEITQHIVRANRNYCSMIETGGRAQQPSEVVEDADRAFLMARLAESEEQVRECFGRITPELLRKERAATWHPLGPPVKGPLDSLWFAHQIVRHSAYHLGQVNYILMLLGLL